MRLLTERYQADQLGVLSCYARMCCPVQEEFRQQYRWSLILTRYSTGLAFCSDAVLMLFCTLSTRTSLPAGIPRGQGRAGIFFPWQEDHTHN